MNDPDYSWWDAPTKEVIAGTACHLCGIFTTTFLLSDDQSPHCCGCTLTGNGHVECLTCNTRGNEDDRRLGTESTRLRSSSSGEV